MLDADSVARSVLDTYKSLPKTGKPGANEWTVLAGFVVVDSQQRHQVKVLSLGTGTKCLPYEARAEHLLTDQHAEVVARRALLVRLLSNVNEFWGDDGKWRKDLSLVMYTSREPCGSSRMSVVGNKRVRVGLCCGMRKPGKGSTSECMSCADKLTKWVAMGMLGGRNRDGLENPPLCAVVVGGAFESQALLQEMLQQRVMSTELPLLLKTNVEFVGDEKPNTHPSGLSINWIEGSSAECTQPNGKKMGANGKGNDVNPKHISRLARVSFLKDVERNASYKNDKKLWTSKFCQRDSNE